MLRRLHSTRVFAPQNLKSNLQTGLVGGWLRGSSGNSWFDMSGYNNNLAATAGQYLWSASRDNLFDAVRLDGTTYAATAATASGYPLSVSGNAITLACWAWIPAVTANNYILIAKNVSDASHTAPFFAYSLHYLGTLGSTTETFRFWVATGGVAASIPVGANTVRYGEWTHITGRYDGTNIEIYINGIFRASTAKTGNIDQYSTQLRIGANGAAGEVLNGSIADVRVYNRALSAAEIVSLANAYDVVTPRNTRRVGAFNRRISSWFISGF